MSKNKLIVFNFGKTDRYAVLCRNGPGKNYRDSGITSPPFRIRSVDDKGVFIYPYWKLANGYVHYGMVQHVLFEEIETSFDMKPVATGFNVLA